MNKFFGPPLVTREKAERAYTAFGNAVQALVWLGQYGPRIAETAEDLDGLRKHVERVQSLLSAAIPALPHVWEKDKVEKYRR